METTDMDNTGYLLILRLLPHHSMMGVTTPNPMSMGAFAERVARTSLTRDHLINFAEGPFGKDGPAYEFGDKRLRYSASKKRWFVRQVIEAHFPA